MVDRYVDPDFEAKLSEWEKYALTINRYRADQYLWSDLNVAVSRATPHGVLLDRIEASVPANEEAAVVEDDPFAADDPLAGQEGAAVGFEGADDEERPWIEIRGTSGDIEPIRTFVANLEKSRVFRNVLLQAADRDADRQGDEIEFRIACRPMVRRETYMAARNAVGGEESR
jgi:Tfp pilus assembly protein PilN